MTFSCVRALWLFQYSWHTALPVFMTLDLSNYVWHNFSRVQDFWLIQYLLVLTFPVLMTGLQMLILCFPTARVIEVQRIDWLWSNPGASKMEGADWGRTKQFLTFELKRCSALVDIHQYVCNVLLYPRIIRMHSPSLYRGFFPEKEEPELNPVSVKVVTYTYGVHKMPPCFEVTLAKSILEWWLLSSMISWTMMSHHTLLNCCVQIGQLWHFIPRKTWRCSQRYPKERHMPRQTNSYPSRIVGNCLHGMSIITGCNCNVGNVF